MSSRKIFRLSSLSIVDLLGQDAETILHNLTTNQIKNLSVGQNVETFITDVKGKTLGHVYACRIENGFRLIGADGQSQAIVDHADRYTIREDAVATIRDNDFEVFVTIGDQDLDPPPTIENHCVGWLGSETRVWLVSEGVSLEWTDSDSANAIGDDRDFHFARTLAAFPWHGIDFDDKNLPQEASRPDAISFTKGCYLGQETVARLDALGQVQKCLVRWSVDHGDVQPECEVFVDEKLVGRLTSIAQVSETKAFAIGVARRSHFEPGSMANGTSKNGHAFTATVVS
ncbi:CAF17-like 4Fe-4S cluster assembly/insertion protein YgfZ [Stieleria varia]|uniref:Putative global regulator n=1 Tax=Stieleria varia TaxID=2528005 RepID=A0A5C6A624_9BACT|nr:aminomethyltransferase [Stieleria varia]TWT93793.1 putative global regulator [Stieleria varia]